MHMKRLMVLIGDRERGKLQLPRKKQIPTLEAYSKTYLSQCEGVTEHSSLGMLQKYSHTGLSNKQHAIQALTDHVLGMNSKPSLAIAQ